MSTGRLVPQKKILTHFNCIFTVTEFEDHPESNTVHFVTNSTHKESNKYELRIFFYKMLTSIGYRTEIKWCTFGQTLIHSHRITLGTVKGQQQKKE